jgi:hypothetical protein
MSIYKFEIIEKTEPYEVTEPFAVFRFLSQVDKIIECDEYIEDPNVSDFFVLLGEIGNNEWIVYDNDAYFVARWLMRPLNFRGYTYKDPGYFFCPYVPLTMTPVVMDPNYFNSKKGILTRYGKKLLAKTK